MLIPGPWQIAFSYGGLPPYMVPHPDGSWGVGFPAGQYHSVNYIYSHWHPIPPDGGLSMTYQVACAGTIRATEGGPGYVTLFLQRLGDDLSGVGPNEFYRLWASHTLLADSQHTISAPFDPAAWTGVYGRHPTQAQFNDCLAGLAHVGMTFGSQSFFGHGCYSTGGLGAFTLNRYEISH